jgi:transcriptional regulator with XRE-family HTH domain
MQEISKRIADLMRNKDITYGDLSRLTGVSKSALQRYVTGITDKIPLDRISLIADALGVTAEYLLGWETEKPTIENNDGLSDLDIELIKMLKSLSDEDAAYVRAFVKRLKANKP